MKIGKRLLGTVLSIALLLAALFYAGSGQSIYEERRIFGANDKITVKLWYTDESLTDYLTAKAVEFNNSSRYSRAELECVPGLEYLEEINRASLEGDSYPDVFIMTHDSLEKAYLAGLASAVDDPAFLEDGSLDFGGAALDSVRYKGKYIAYPYYFETSSLLYNRTYLEDEVRNRIQAEIDAAEGEAAQAEIDANEPEAGDEEGVAGVNEEAVISDEELEAAVNELLPNTIEDILLFADSYNAPEDVESVFEWDVTDIFCNYFFVGNYMDLGGESGDDTSLTDIYNEDTINCMSFYQQLGQFFAIDEAAVDYDKVIQDFIDGKTVFTVATSDAVARLEEEKKNGNCSFDYGAAYSPALNDTYATRTMSVTDALVINGYSEHPAQANEFARFLCSETGDTMYNMSGKLIAHGGVDYENDALEVFGEVYRNSVPMPKLMETANFWVLLEIAFENIWDGADVNDTLRALSENIKLQINGEQVTEERLPDATVTITNAE